jgi:predicted small lipoprotein YifL
MKKIVALLLVLVMVFALAACGQDKPAEEPVVEENTAEEAAAEETAEETAEEPAEETAEEPAEETEVQVMSYAEYAAAEVDSPVVIEAYVQAHQSWWDNKISVYAQDPDGAYFLYDMACSEEDAAKLVPGQKIRVTGFKGEWSGEVEIVDATFTFVDGDTWVAEPLNVNELLGTEELAEHMNQFFSVTEGTIADKGDGAAFFYNWDNSGEDGNCDLYFDVEINGATYTFVARRYLTAPGSEVYEAVKNLQVGDTVDIEGFLYWYEGVQPHITSITVK